jgi:hypothetical protein
LAVGVVAVGVEVGAVVLVVEQVECLGKDLQAVAAEAAIGYRSSFPRADLRWRSSAS